MSNIQFNDEQGFRSQPTQPPFLVRLILNTGLVSTEKYASYILFIFLVLSIIFVWFVSFSGNNSNSLSKTDIQRITQLQQESNSNLRQKP